MPIPHPFMCNLFPALPAYRESYMLCESVMIPSVYMIVFNGPV
jgi:hypothetical protein